MPLPPGLAEALVEVATLMRPARDPWWLIGSAAAVLHGAPIDGVGDLDVLASRRDAGRVLGELGRTPAPGAPSERFKSDVLDGWHTGSFTFELMAGFHLRTPSGWVEVIPTTREEVFLGDCKVFVPSRSELRDLFLRFGRSKDLARAALLA